MAAPLHFADGGSKGEATYSSKSDRYSIIRRAWHVTAFDSQLKALTTAVREHQHFARRIFNLATLLIV
jgi:hypothetical protein